MASILDQLYQSNIDFNSTSVPPMQNCFFDSQIAYYIGVSNDIENPGSNNAIQEGDYIFIGIPEFGIMAAGITDPAPLNQEDIQSYSVQIPLPSSCPDQSDADSFNEANFVVRYYRPGLLGDDCSNLGGVEDCEDEGGIGDGHCDTVDNFPGTPERGCYWDQIGFGTINDSPTGGGSFPPPVGIQCTFFFELPEADPPKLVISEIFHNDYDDNRNIPDYIEIYNATASETIDLSNWVISDGINEVSLVTGIVGGCYDGDDILPDIEDEEECEDEGGTWEDSFGVHPLPTGYETNTLSPGERFVLFTHNNGYDDDGAKGIKDDSDYFDLRWLYNRGQCEGGYFEPNQCYKILNYEDCYNDGYGCIYTKWSDMGLDNGNGNNCNSDVDCCEQRLPNGLCSPTGFLGWFPDLYDEGTLLNSESLRNPSYCGVPCGLNSNVNNGSMWNAGITGCGSENDEEVPVALYCDYSNGMSYSASDMSCNACVNEDLNGVIDWKEDAGLLEIIRDDWSSEYPSTGNPNTWIIHPQWWFIETNDSISFGDCEHGNVVDAVADEEFDGEGYTDEGYEGLYLYYNDDATCNPVDTSNIKVGWTNQLNNIESGGGNYLELKEKDGDTVIYSFRFDYGSSDLIDNDGKSLEFKYSNHPLSTNSNTEYYGNDLDNWQNPREHYCNGYSYEAEHGLIGGGSGFCDPDSAFDDCDGLTLDGFDIEVENVCYYDPTVSCTPGLEDPYGYGTWDDDKSPDCAFLIPYFQTKDEIQLSIPGSSNYKKYIWNETSSSSNYFGGGNILARCGPCVANSFQPPSSVLDFVEDWTILATELDLLGDKHVRYMNWTNQTKSNYNLIKDNETELDSQWRNFGTPGDQNTNLTDDYIILTGCTDIAAVPCVDILPLCYDTSGNGSCDIWDDGYGCYSDLYHDSCLGCCEYDLDPICADADALNTYDPIPDSGWMDDTDFCEYPLIIEMKNPEYNDQDSGLNDIRDTECGGICNTVEIWITTSFKLADLDEINFSGIELLHFLPADGNDWGTISVSNSGGPKILIGETELPWPNIEGDSFKNVSTLFGKIVYSDANGDGGFLCSGDGGVKLNDSSETIPYYQCEDGQNMVDNGCVDLDDISFNPAGDETGDVRQIQYGSDDDNASYGYSCVDTDCNGHLDGDGVWSDICPNWCTGGFESLVDCEADFAGKLGQSEPAIGDNFCDNIVITTEEGCCEYEGDPPNLTCVAGQTAAAGECCGSITGKYCTNIGSGWDTGYLDMGNTNGLVWTDSSGTLHPCYNYDDRSYSENFAPCGRIALDGDIRPYNPDDGETYGCDEDTPDTWCHVTYNTDLVDCSGCCFYNGLPGDGNVCDDASGNNREIDNCGQCAYTDSHCSTDCSSQYSIDGESHEYAEDDCGYCVLVSSDNKCETGPGAADDNDDGVCDNQAECQSVNTNFCYFWNSYTTWNGTEYGCYDCDGNKDGTTDFSTCGICSDNATEGEDCDGNCDGDLVIGGCDDGCGSTAVDDCFGVCGGDGLIDDCGLCYDSGSYPGNQCADGSMSDGVCSGTATGPNFGCDNKCYGPSYGDIGSDYADYDTYCTVANGSGGYRSEPDSDIFCESDDEKNDPTGYDCCNNTPGHGNEGENCRCVGGDSGASACTKDCSGYYCHTSCSQLDECNDCHVASSHDNSTMVSNPCATGYPNAFGAPADTNSSCVDDANVFQFCTDITGEYCYNEGGSWIDISGIGTIFANYAATDYCGICSSEAGCITTYDASSCDVGHLPNILTNCTNIQADFVYGTTDFGGPDFDCNCVCSGDSYINQCDECGNPPNPDCVDASGGNTNGDWCGTCDADCVGNSLVTDEGCCAGLTKDCNGDCGGSLVEDCLGVCGGDAVEDCAGVCDGSAVIDDCGYCWCPSDEGGSCDTIVQNSHCSGCIDGDACNDNERSDDGGTCSTTALASGGAGSECTIDTGGCEYAEGTSCVCDGGSNNTPDDGYCGCNDEVLDECGVCNADASDDCTQDCLGEYGGSAELDICGYCDGDGSSCTGCTVDNACNDNQRSDGGGQCSTADFGVLCTQADDSYCNYTSCCNEQGSTELTGSCICTDEDAPASGGYCNNALSDCSEQFDDCLNCAGGFSFYTCADYHGGATCGSYDDGCGGTITCTGDANDSNNDGTCDDDYECSSGSCVCDEALDCNGVCHGGFTTNGCADGDPNYSCLESPNPPNLACVAEVDGVNACCSNGYESVCNDGVVSSGYVLMVGCDFSDVDSWYSNCTNVPSDIGDCDCAYDNYDDCGTCCNPDDGSCVTFATCPTDSCGNYDNGCGDISLDCGSCSEPNPHCNGQPTGTCGCDSGHTGESSYGASDTICCSTHVDLCGVCDGPIESNSDCASYQGQFCCGCTDSSSCEYDYGATIDDGSCILNDDNVLWNTCSDTSEGCDCSDTCGGYADLDCAGDCAGGASLTACQYPDCGPDSWCEDISECTGIDECGKCGDTGPNVDCCDDEDVCASDSPLCDSDPTNPLCVCDNVDDECGNCGGDYLNYDGSEIGDGGTFDNGFCDCDGNSLDCAGICNGSNTAGCSDNDACNYDSGTGGNDDCDDGSCYYPVDNCHDCASSDGAGDGACGGDNECEEDCAGDCDGTAELDSCGVCSGGNSGHDANSDMDCNDTCFGNASDDNNCSYCVGGSEEPASLLECVQDCADAWFYRTIGTEGSPVNSLNECYECNSGGTEPTETCKQDCDGSWTTTSGDWVHASSPDDCGVCYSQNDVDGDFVPANTSTCTTGYNGNWETYTGLNCNCSCDDGSVYNNCGICGNGADTTLSCNDNCPTSTPYGDDTEHDLYSGGVTPVLSHCNVCNYDADNNATSDWVLDDKQCNGCCPPGSNGGEVGDVVCGGQDGKNLVDYFWNDCKYLYDNYAIGSSTDYCVTADTNTDCDNTNCNSDYPCLESSYGDGIGNGYCAWADGCGECSGGVTGYVANSGKDCRCECVEITGGACYGGYPTGVEDIDWENLCDSNDNDVGCVDPVYQDDCGACKHPDYFCTESEDGCVTSGNECRDESEYPGQCNPTYRDPECKDEFVCTDNTQIACDGISGSDPLCPASGACQLNENYYATCCYCINPDDGDEPCVASCDNYDDVYDQHCTSWNEYNEDYGMNSWRHVFRGNIFCSEDEKIDPSEFKCCNEDTGEGCICLNSDEAGCTQDCNSDCVDDITTCQTACNGNESGCADGDDTTCGCQGDDGWFLTFGGTDEIDDCGECGGSNDQYCNGECVYNNDTPYGIDDCGDCKEIDGSTWNPPSDSAPFNASPNKDCYGSCEEGTTLWDEADGGTAVIDDCGVCSGGNSGHDANSDIDECGICGGGGSLNDCGECVVDWDSNDCDACQKDCGVTITYDDGSTWSDGSSITPICVEDTLENCTLGCDDETYNSIYEVSCLVVGCATVSLPDTHYNDACGICSADGGATGSCLVEYGGSGSAQSCNQEEVSPYIILDDCPEGESCFTTGGFTDDCGICGGGNDIGDGHGDQCDCAGQIYDCQLECGGTHNLDDCGYCGDWAAGAVSTYKDCNGDCPDDAQIPCTDTNGSGSCGDAEIDDCGICSGGNSGHTANAELDCNTQCLTTVGVSEGSDGYYRTDANPLVIHDDGGDWTTKFEIGEQILLDITNDSDELEGVYVIEGFANNNQDLQLTFPPSWDPTKNWIGTVDDLSGYGVTIKRGGASEDTCSVCSGGSTGIPVDFKDCGGNCILGGGCNDSWTLSDGYDAPYGGTCEFLDDCGTCTTNSGEGSFDCPEGTCPDGSSAYQVPAGYPYNAEVYCNFGGSGSNYDCECHCPSVYGGDPSTIDSCGNCIGGDTGYLETLVDCRGVDGGGCCDLNQSLGHSSCDYVNDDCNDCVDPDISADVAGGYNNRLPCECPAGQACASCDEPLKTVDNCGVCVNIGGECGTDCNGEYDGCDDNSGGGCGTGYCCHKGFHLGTEYTGAFDDTTISCVTGDPASDCSNALSGKAILDPNCGISGAGDQCVGGLTGLTSCSRDCSGNYCMEDTGGSTWASDFPYTDCAYLDSCGNCVHTNIDSFPCLIDGSTLYTTQFVCADDNSISCSTLAEIDNTDCDGGACIETLWGANYQYAYDGDICVGDTDCHLDCAGDYWWYDSYNPIVTIVDGGLVAYIDDCSQCVYDSDSCGYGGTCVDAGAGGEGCPLTCNGTYCVEDCAYVNETDSCSECITITSDIPNCEIYQSGLTGGDEFYGLTCTDVEGGDDCADVQCGSNFTDDCSICGPSNLDGFDYTGDGWSGTFTYEHERGTDCNGECPNSCTGIECGFHTMDYCNNCLAPSDANRNIGNEYSSCCNGQGDATGYTGGTNDIYGAGYADGAQTCSCYTVEQCDSYGIECGEYDKGFCGDDCLGEIDDCDVCDGGNSDQGCDDVCFSGAIADDHPDTGISQCCTSGERDDCGVCFGGNLDQDCAGECFGDLELDECGVCDGNNNDLTDCGCFIAASKLYCDDADGDGVGDSNSDNWVSYCEVCGDDATNVQCPTTLSEAEGTWYWEGSGQCSDEWPGCDGIVDCNGICGGDSYVDDCGTCQCGPETDTPSNNCNSTDPVNCCDTYMNCPSVCSVAWVCELGTQNDSGADACNPNTCDECSYPDDDHNCDGTCGGVNSSVEDCAGVCAGDSELDFCGVCDGDNTTCCNNGAPSDASTCSCTDGGTDFGDYCDDPDSACVGPSDDTNCCNHQYDYCGVCDGNCTTEPTSTDATDAADDCYVWNGGCYDCNGVNVGLGGETGFDACDTCGGPYDEVGTCSSLGYECGDNVDNCGTALNCDTEFGTLGSPCTSGLDLLNADNDNYTCESNTCVCQTDFPTYPADPSNFGLCGEIAYDDIQGCGCITDENCPDTVNGTLDCADCVDCTSTEYSFDVDDLGLFTCGGGGTANLCGCSHECCTDAECQISNGDSDYGTEASCNAGTCECTPTIFWNSYGLCDYYGDDDGNLHSCGSYTVDNGCNTDVTIECTDGQFSGSDCPPNFICGGAV
tara:strand:+ start:3222 stop:18161 length:14940 start_codon:yes stop_codon:yes gene_type:complete